MQFVWSISVYYFYLICFAYSVWSIAAYFVWLIFVRFVSSISAYSAWVIFAWSVWLFWERSVCFFVYLSFGRATYFF